MQEREERGREEQENAFKMFSPSSSLAKIIVAGGECIIAIDKEGWCRRGTEEWEEV